MLRLKILLLIALGIFPAFSFIGSNVVYPIKWVLTNECTLKVNGSTNINKFSCVIPEYAKPDTLIFYKEQKNDPVKMSGFMALDVQNFDCHNPVMTSDLRKTLKVKIYPKIIIRFLSLNRYPDQNKKTDLVKGMVTIELAGTVRRYEIDYKYMAKENDNLNLIGTRQVKFSDFNINPPRKLGGMIKTDDELSVEFILNARILN